MTKSAQNMLAVNARNVATAAPVAAFLGLASTAGAQATSYSLDLSAPIGSFGSAMTGTITSNSPALFGILALSVGFFFLWGRVKALF